MAQASATLHFLCGKIAAGKSTLTARLGEAANTIVLGEDFLLSRLYPGEINNVGDYVRYAGRLRQAIEPHVVDLLRLGVSVVLDFPANTLPTRQWLRSLFERAGAEHQLHFLDEPDEVCKARLRARNARGEHEFAASDAEFDLITRHFVAPDPGEGFHVIRYRDGRIVR